MTAPSDTPLLLEYEPPKLHIHCTALSRYDEVIEIDLSSLQPHLNGPFTPDRGNELSDMKASAAKQGVYTRTRL